MPEETSFDFVSKIETKPYHVKLPRVPGREEFPFLIAEHSFDVASLEKTTGQRDPTAICLSFSVKELAYVHYVHSSGWCDVTLIKSGERGWVPIDYFSGFTDPRALPLLASAAAFLANPLSQKLPISSSVRMYTFSEAAINEIISGSKLLLSKTGILDKDSRLNRQFAEIASSRKAMLTELAHLVRVAKYNKYSTDDKVIDKLIRGCYRLLERSVLLLACVDDTHNRSTAGPSKDGVENGRSNSRLSTMSSKSTKSSKSRVSLRSISSSRSTTSIDTVGTSLYRINSFCDHEMVPQPMSRLQEVINAFVFYLQGFLDSDKLLADPGNPSTSPAILTLTRHCMLACRELFAVLDLVPLDGSTNFDSRDELLEEIRRLVNGARSVVAALPPSPASLRLVATQSLVIAASKCHALSLENARRCSTYLLAHPHLKLSSDRSYPIFNVGTPVNLNLSPSSNSELIDIDQQKTEDHTFSSSATRERLENENSLSKLTLGRVRDSENATQNSSSSASAYNVFNGTVLSPRLSDQSLEDGTFKNGIKLHNKELSDEDIQYEKDQSIQRNSEEQNQTPITPVTPNGEIASELVMRNGKVRGGMLSSLVEWLTGPDYLNLELEIRIFLLCFRFFATPHELLIELGSHEINPGVKHLAKTWIQSFWEPDDGVLNSLIPLVDADIIKSRRKSSLESNTITQLVDLPLNPSAEPIRTSSVTSTSSSGSTSTTSSATTHRHYSFGAQFGTSSALNLAQSFRDFSLGSKRASRQVSNDDVRSTSHRTGSQSSLSASYNNSNKDIFHHTLSSVSTAGENVTDTLLSREPIEYAQQLTLMWMEIFKDLRPAELLDQRYSASKRSQGLAPHVVQLVLSSNHLTSFVGDTILSPEISTRQRSRILKLWIRVAEEMFNLGNLNGTVTIISTLQSTRIVRLQKVWDSLGAKSHSVFDKLRIYTSPDRNFSEYRQELKRRIGQPCIPYIGILLGDLTLVDEGNPKYLKPTKAINMDRYMKMGIIISEIQPFQQSEFDINADVSLQTWIRNHMATSFSRDARDNDEQWRRSLLIQPQE